MNLGTLKTHVANRTGNDAVSNVLTEFTNQVIYDISTRYPFRWRMSLPVSVNCVANQNYINPSAYFPNFGDPYDAVQLSTPQKLLYMPIWNVNLLDPDWSQTNPTRKQVPTHYCMDFDNNRLWLYPTPDQNYPLKFRYLKNPSEISNASSTLFVPSKYHFVVVSGVESLVWQMDEDLNSARAASERFEAGISRMIEEEQNLPDFQPTFESQQKFVDFSDPFLEI